MTTGEERPAAEHDPAAGDPAFSLEFLAPEEAPRFHSYCTVEEFAAGTILMEDGAPGDFLAFVLAGKLAVRKATAFPGRHILMAEIEAGGLVGERAGVVKGERAATVVAVTPSRLLILTHDRLRQMMAQEPELALRLLQRIILIQGHRLRKASERLSWIL